ncbi:GspE/PulE family protein [Prochlorococcus sp. MIT 1307]|uniref:GspE/PulE family protein n=1 Tax=Prochlorococcus sp. MIT 1307 TaxID=3096219 RepID=UPI002A753A41|nr:GspE/PulE family protein [Prochlorococcus sp. MIT 1307]
MSKFQLSENNKTKQKENIEDFLTPKLCEDAGIIAININHELIDLGAMNPDYIKVKQVIKRIKSEYQLKVNLKQITSHEWEKWFEDQQSRATESSQKVFNQNNTIKSEFNSLPEVNEGQYKNYYNKDSEEFNNPFVENTEVMQLEPDNQNSESLSNSFQSEDEDEDEDEDFSLDLIDEENDEALIKLATANIGEDPDIENDRFFGEELTESKDPVIAGVASILSKCFSLKGSDIHAEPLEDRLRIRYRIDGVLKEAFSFPKSHINPIVSRIKIMSRLDISEKRLPQDGRIRCLLRGRKSDFRVSTLPGKWGEKVVLRALESDSSVLNLSNLITEKEELNLIQEMAKSPYGIVIVVGPTGSGKSTTLYSMLSELNTPGVNISTVEDPVEYTLDGIHQVQVIREKGLDFSRALRSLMRQDPDIILVGETRDKETAQAAMEAALTGHMVFTTMHANDTATAITRLAEMEIPPYLIGSSIVGVVAQRLVRKVCVSCSTVRNLQHGKDDLALNLGIKQARFLKKNVASGKASKRCSICGGSGYKGRVGIYEVMKVNDLIRDLIMKQSNADEIRDNAFTKAGRSLLIYGMNLVKNQMTTIAEVERVCLLDEPSTEEQ